MKRPPTDIFTDMSKVTSSFLNTLGDVKQDVEQLFQEKLQHYIGRLQLVTREEFEVVRTLASQLAKENAALEARIALLEKHSAAPAKPKKTTPPKTQP